MTALPVIDDPSPEDVHALDDRLTRFNLDCSGIADARYLSIFLRDACGTLYAGLHGHSWGGYCEIGLLWVAATHRGRGIGSALIAAAEGEAIARGCRRIILSTHSFQAPAFYRKHGFTIFATVPDCPIGHAHQMMIKDVRT